MHSGISIYLVYCYNTYFCALARSTFPENLLRLHHMSNTHLISQYYSYSMGEHCGSIQVFCTSTYKYVLNSIWEFPYKNCSSSNHMIISALCTRWFVLMAHFCKLSWWGKVSSSIQNCRKKHHNSCCIWIFYVILKHRTEHLQCTPRIIRGLKVRIIRSIYQKRVAYTAQGRLSFWVVISLIVWIYTCMLWHTYGMFYSPYLILLTELDFLTPTKIHVGVNVYQHNFSSLMYATELTRYQLLLEQWVLQYQSCLHLNERVL